MARRQVEEEKPRRTTRKTAPEKEVKAPPVRRRSSKTEVAVADEYESPRERAKKALATNLDLADALDAIEKHYGMSGSSVSKDEPRQDTGLLVIDLILGRGLVPGWYTIFGPEQSCKSTTAVTILANMLNSLVDVILYFDYEGSAEPNYLQNIMKQGGVTMPIDQVFGIKDDEGNWKVKPRVRYYTESVGEKFFDYMAKLLRVLPDKKRIGKEWFLIYENTKENQKICGSRYDKDYLRKTGLLRIPAPDGKLQAVVLLDSYPGMLPEKLDTDDPNSAIGAQARMFSDQIKRIKGKFKAKRVALLGINQLRDKPMVMFGCFFYTSKVLLANGKTEMIGKIVNSKMPVEVMSYNVETQKFEPKKVVGWYNNGNAVPGEFMTLRVMAGKAHGCNEIKCTRGHQILDHDTGKFKAAEEFQLGDSLVTFAEIEKFNSDQLQLIYGSILGDGSVHQSQNGKVALRFGHNVKQSQYIGWKHTMLHEVAASAELKSNSDGTVLSFGTKPLCNKFLRKLAVEANVDKGFRTYSGLPKRVLNKLDLRGLAVWYQDDGTFYASKPGPNGGQYWQVGISCKRLDKSDRQALACKIRDLTGVEFAVNDSGLLLCDKEMIRTFHDAIAPYMVEELKYKCYDGVTGVATYVWNTKTKETVTVPFPATVVEIRNFEPYPGMSKGKYDLQVEGNHTYIVENCVVHNSPHYEPGGNALKFFSDVRLQATPRALSGVPEAKGKGYNEEEDSVTHKGSDTYRYIHLRAAKNKLSQPGGEGWLRLWIEDATGEARGFDPVWDTYQYLKATGQVQGSRSRGLKLNVNGHECKKALDWYDFKLWVLGTKEDKVKVCKYLGFPKPFCIRKYCRKQLNSGDGWQKFLDAKQMQNEEDKVKKTAKSEGSDDDE